MKVMPSILIASLLGVLTGLLGSTAVYGWTNSVTRVPALETVGVPRGIVLASRPVLSVPVSPSTDVPVSEFQEGVDSSMLIPGRPSVRSVWAAVGAASLVAVGALLRLARPAAIYEEVPDVEFGGDYGEGTLSGDQGGAMPTLVSRVLGPLNPFRMRDMALGAKRKGIRLIVTLECTEARGLGETPSRYTTEKNKKNTSARLELRKYNKYLRRHTLHREIK